MASHHRDVVGIELLPPGMMLHGQPVVEMLFASPWSSSGVKKSRRKYLYPALIKRLEYGEKTAKVKGGRWRP
ncbi:hypothetical protein CFAM422_009349 [Trichoderma lentiforme]|uniref:Uncharacterized protein n=1 Tax=Trichoderma lentiforme TaxID=1567552 RepID=A0A9P5C965_9HYPO|nr:hypothetical protein CFAM422_009349 [Trichoderma lentiforme]